MRKKITYIFIVFLFLITRENVILAQSYSTIEDFNHTNSLTTSAIIRNGKFLVNGWMVDTAAPYKNLNLFSEIDIETGHQSSYLRFGYNTDDLNFNEDCFTEVPGGGFVSGGAVALGGGCILLFYDSVGVVTDTTVVSDTTAILFYPKSILYKDSAIYYLIIRSVVGDANLLLVKVDLNGNILWSESYGIPSMTEMAGSLLDLDTCILIGASRSNLNHVPYTVEQISHTWLLAIDTAGNILNEWLDPDPKTYWPDKMLKTEDGKVIMAGGYRGTYSWSPSYEAKWHGYIASFDLSTWSKEWWKQHGNFTNTTYFHDIDTVNGGYLLTGNNSNPPITISPPRGWLLKTDLNGDMIWERKYLPFGTGLMNCDLRETVFLPSGDMISVGWADNGNYHSWILRTDEHGCLVPNCHSIGLEEEHISDFGLKVYPNPANSVIYFTTEKEIENGMLVEVYDIWGRSLLVKPLLTTTTEIQTTEMQNGIYVYRITENGMRVEHGKFIVRH